MTQLEKLDRTRLTLQVLLEIVQKAAQGQPQDWIDVGRSIRRTLKDVE